MVGPLLGVALLSIGCIVLLNSVLLSLASHYFDLRCIVLDCFALALLCIALLRIALIYSALLYITLCIALLCIAVHCSASHCVDVLCIGLLRIQSRRQHQYRHTPVAADGNTTQVG